MLKNSLKMLLAGLMAVVFAADGWGARETVNGIEWQYIIRNGSAIVRDENQSWTAAISRSTVGGIIIPSQLGGCPVTDIGDNAFSSCSSLTSVTIPESVTNVRAYAFVGCTGLTSIMLPDSLMTIEPSAFAGCTGLTSMTIPDSVTSIGIRAFADCAGLTSVTLPDRLMGIDQAAFDGCAGLISVTIPDSVTWIGGRAFAGCTGLTSVMIPNSVTRIEPLAFYECISLTSVTIPESVTSIEWGAFDYCEALIEVVFAGLPPVVDEDAFAGCEDGVGYYPSSHRNEWVAVIDSEGYWQGLKMQMVESADPSGDTIVVTDAKGKEIAIETSWFEDLAEKLSAKFGSRDWAAVAKMATGKTDAGGKALTVLDDYIAGTDPTDEDDTFKVTIKMGADGNPVITWDPALNDDETHKGVKEGVRTYKVFGNIGLSADGWQEVEQGASGEWRRVETGEIVSPQFFKVSVAMP